VDISLESVLHILSPNNLGRIYNAIVTYYWVVMITFQDLIAERNALRYIDFPISPEDLAVIQRIVSDSGRMIPLLQLLDDRSSFNVSLLDHINEV
jgi:hypothetical protein